MRTEKQKMLAGELYRAGDPEIQADQAAAKSWMVRYNAALGASAAERRALLRELLPEVGDGAVIRPPFHCDFGYNIRLGRDVFLNFNCVILDVVAVAIGAGTQIGPAVQIYTADHPRDPALRKTGAEFGRPVSIGTERLDRRRRDYSPGANHRRRCRGRGRCSGHPRRAARSDRSRQSGPSKEDLNCRGIRVPDAVRHSSCRSAEPGPRFLTSPYRGPGSAAHRFAKCHSASKTRVNALMALRCVRGTRSLGNSPRPIHRAETSSVHGAARQSQAWIVPAP